MLHTWGQDLSLHPHIHCIVPAAGFTLDGQWKNIGHSGKFLHPVHQLNDAVIGRFMDSLKRALRKQNELQFIPAQSPDIDALIKRKELPESNLQRFQRIIGIDPCHCRCVVGKEKRTAQDPITQLATDFSAFSHLRPVLIQPAAAGKSMPFGYQNTRKKT